MKLLFLTLAITISQILGTYDINDRYPDVSIRVDAPQMLDPAKPTEIIFYALPNGCNLDHAEGRWCGPNDDERFGSQHIAAQTKFIRENNPETNYISVCLMENHHSWTTWRRRHADLIPQTLEAVLMEVIDRYADYKPTVTLGSHSGGGYFLWEYIRASECINPMIKRLVFIDSTYGYMDHEHLAALTKWLKDKSHYLCVISYEDSNVIYDGKPLVTRYGGTWGRSHAMVNDLSKTFRFSETVNGDWEDWRALGGRITFKLLRNPEGKIWHTRLVGQNGFIDSKFTGTPKEGVGYTFWGDRAYTEYIGDAGCHSTLVNEAGHKPLPFLNEHKGNGLTGWDFIESIDDMDFWDFEEKTLLALLEGNVPDSLRFFRKIRYQRLGHTVEFWALPDYLAVGTNDDFVRIPMGIISSRKVAKVMDCCLPTTFLVDRINDVAEGALDIFPFRPLRGRNSLPIVFQDHNNALKALYKAKGYHFGQFISGLKKDLVETIYIDKNPEYANNIAIYGWHHPDGHPQQPLFLRHANFYSDYSHGTRLIWHEITVDGQPFELDALMHDPELYRLVSDEPEAL